MSPKKSKSERKEDRVQELERELAQTKKKLAEQQKSVRLDDLQLKESIDELTECISWATNRIVDESRPKYIPVMNNSTTNSSFSLLLKLIIGLPMFLMVGAVALFLWNSGAEYWVQGSTMRLALVILGIVGIDCLYLGIEIFREKDRNYVVALFSALVSLVALIVALVK